jgi:hypothetical protein
MAETIETNITTAYPGLSIDDAVRKVIRPRGQDRWELIETVNGLFPFYSSLVENQSLALKGAINAEAERLRRERADETLKTLDVVVPACGNAIGLRGLTIDREWGKDRHIFESMPSMGSLDSLQRSLETTLFLYRDRVDDGLFKFLDTYRDSINAILQARPVISHDQLKGSPISASTTTHIFSHPEGFGGVVTSNTTIRYDGSYEGASNEKGREEWLHYLKKTVHPHLVKAIKDGNYSGKKKALDIMGMVRAVSDMKRAKDYFGKIGEWENSQKLQLNESLDSWNDKLGHNMVERNLLLGTTPEGLHEQYMKQLEDDIAFMLGYLQREGYSFNSMRLEAKPKARLQQAKRLYDKFDEVSEKPERPLGWRSVGEPTNFEAHIRRRVERALRFPNIRYIAADMYKKAVIGVLEIEPAYDDLGVRIVLSKKIHR